MSPSARVATLPEQERPPPPARPEPKGEGMIAELFSQAEERQKASGGTAGAEFLHTELPAEYWGVSRQQLQGFAEEIRKMLRTGSHPAGYQLRNMSKDECKRRGIPHYKDAKFADLKVGPNMYQVNEGVVKPATLQADSLHGIPCLSYAVKQNSELGLLCDLFASHAWSEGVFELTDTLIDCWPEKARGVYICVLSNPQNMDSLIARLVQSPRDSPFYRVLVSRPSKMLMVANSNVPIHSRLWCVYEAHCARTMGISVAVVGDPAHFATKAGASKAANRAIQDAVHARRKELAINEAMEDAAADMDILAAGMYLTRYRKMEKRAARANAAAMKKMQRALDVRKAQCSHPRDGEAIRSEVQGQTDEINAMICDLIVKDQLERAPGGPPVKMTWYWGQDMVEGIAALAS